MRKGSEVMNDCGIKDQTLVLLCQEASLFLACLKVDEMLCSPSVLLK